MTRTILITGCSSGIGLDAARTLTQRGWRVIATARTAEGVERLQRIEHLEALQLELADQQSIATCAIAALNMTGGKLGAIFNNAAFGQMGAVEDVTPLALREQFEVNVFGTHDLTRRILPAMRRNGAGRIVNCSSVLGFVAAPYRGAYCASKFALEALSQSMAMELSGSGIHVALIEPGPIRTRFVETALAKFKANIDIEHSPHRLHYEARMAAMERGGKETFKLEPEAVSKRLVHALESARPKRRYYVTKPTFFAAVGKRILPNAAIEYFAKNF